MIIEANKHRAGAALPILHALQHVFGCVPEAAVPLVAEALNLSRAEIYGTVTFYHDFRNEPRAGACSSFAVPNPARPRVAMRSQRAPRKSSA
jgi:formate dehydrogenase subunit gamma